MYRTFRPDLENPTVEEAYAGFQSFQGMPVPWVVLYLASDESRLVTGLQLPVDAGATVRCRAHRAGTMLTTVLLPTRTATVAPPFSSLVNAMHCPSTRAS